MTTQDDLNVNNWEWGKWSTWGNDGLKWHAWDIRSAIDEVPENEKFQKYWFDKTEKQDIKNVIENREKITVENTDSIQNSDIFSRFLEIVERRMWKKEKNKEWWFDSRPFWLEKFPKAQKESEEGLEELSQEVKKILDLDRPLKADKNSEYVKQLRFSLAQSLKNYWLNVSWINNTRLPDIKNSIEQKEKKMASEWQIGEDLRGNTNGERAKTELCEMMKILSNFKIEHVVEEYVNWQEHQREDALRKIMLEEYDLSDHTPDLYNQFSNLIDKEDTVIKDENGEIIEDAIKTEEDIPWEPNIKRYVIRSKTTGKEIDGKSERKGEDKRMVMMDMLHDKFPPVLRIEEYVMTRVYQPLEMIGKKPIGDNFYRGINMHKHGGKAFLEDN